MNNDYLWDRTGSEPEIERLETLLAGLAFRPNESSIANSKEIQRETRSPSWFLRLAFGFAAASVAAFAVIFILLPGDDDLRPETFTLSAVASMNEAGPVQSSIPEVEYIKASSSRPRKRVPKKRVRRDAKFVAVPEEPRPLPVVTLTAEERDAYRQLMTALAITGEKLSIVRNKLDGTKLDPIKP